MRGHFLFLAVNRSSGAKSGLYERIRGEKIKIKFQKPTKKAKNSQKGEKILKKIKACYMMEGQKIKEGFV